MNKKNIITVIIILLAVIILVSPVLRRIKPESKPLSILPFLGNLDSNDIANKYKNHTIPNFSFVNQDGNTVTQDNFENKIYIANCFFVTCMSICPIMSTQMQYVQKKYANNSNVLFLSHTVNPENDSVAVLKDYAKAHEAIKDKWHFVTGNKKDLYSILRKGYLLNSEIGTGSEEDFIHSQLFDLIDKNRNIRGSYDGTNPKDIEKLIEDIDILLKEQF
jgi:protein SCO1